MITYTYDTSKMVRTANDIISSLASAGVKRPSLKRINQEINSTLEIANEHHRYGTWGSKAKFIILPEQREKMITAIKAAFAK